MLFEFEATGKTIEKAIENALFELKAVREDVDIKIIEQGGLFKKARVLVSISDDAKDKYAKREEVRKEIVKEEVAAEKEEKKLEKEEIKEEKKAVKECKKEAKKAEKLTAENFIEGFVKVSGCGDEIKAERRENEVVINIVGNKASDLIGYRGECLNALSYVASVIENENAEKKTRVILDIENYRAKREATLNALAERMAKKVLKTGKAVKLEPMSANDRRIIHTALQSVEGVTTESKGTEPNRYLVILPENDAQ